MRNCRFHSRLAFLFVTLWLICVVRADDFDPARLTQIAEAEMKETNTPGAAIAIVRNGEMLWAKGLGLANVETGQPVTPEMLFRLGSTTKMFTAAALVGLAEEGKLKLDEPIGNCIVGLHPAIAALSPHQLLTHTAGLTDESIMSGRHDDDALAAYARTMDPSWLFTEPGKIHSYANPGYWLAGLACQEIAGKPYADLMTERLFRPLGMNRTTLRPTLAMTWPLALGHEVRGDKPSIVRPQADNAATWPAGQMYSSVLDLARFTTAFLDNGRLDGKQILSPTLIANLTSPHVPRPGDDGHYGYGLAVSTERGVRIWQHGGSRTGYGSTIRMAQGLQDNSEKISLIILTNRSASSLPKTATAALEMLLSFQPQPAVARAKRQPLTEQQMAELAGTYTNNRQTIELKIENGELIARRSGFEATAASATLTWAGDNRLALTRSAANGDDALATTYFLVRDSSGRPEYLLSGSRALKRKP